MFHMRQEKHKGILMAILETYKLRYASVMNDLEGREKKEMYLF
jgi:hypothetical protein